MKTDEALLIERFHNQKHNRRNNGYVGERAGHVVGESAGRRRGGDRSSACCTLRTTRSIRDLGSASRTKSHWGLLENDSQDDRHVIRTLAEAQWPQGGDFQPA